MAEKKAPDIQVRRGPTPWLAPAPARPPEFQGQSLQDILVQGGDVARAALGVPGYAPVNRQQQEQDLAAELGVKTSPAPAKGYEVEWNPPTSAVSVGMIMPPQLKALRAMSGNTELAELAAEKEAQAVGGATGLSPSPASPRTGGYFLDPAGQEIPLGPNTHKTYLEQQGLMPPREAGYSDIATALRKQNWVRGRETPSGVQIETGTAPTAAQVRALQQRLAGGPPSRYISIDAYAPGNIGSNTFYDPDAAMQWLQKFYAGAGGGK